MLCFALFCLALPAQCSAGQHINENDDGGVVLEQFMQFGRSQMSMHSVPK